MWRTASRLVSELLREERLRFCAGCADTIPGVRALPLGRARGAGRAVKQNDHAMDDIRYFAATLLARGEPGCAAAAAARG